MLEWFRQSGTQDAPSDVLMHVLGPDNCFPEFLVNIGPGPFVAGSFNGVTEMILFPDFDGIHGQQKDRKAESS